MQRNANRNNSESAHLQRLWLQWSRACSQVGKPMLQSTQMVLRRDGRSYCGLG